jgi:Sulfotransferase domain
MTQTDLPRRARSIAELCERSERFSTEESRSKGLAFQPRPTDIFISPTGKSGTTWLQQIVHGLRTRGSMDFDEITAVVPWLEMAHDLGLDIHAEQVAQPRAYKSHLMWDDIPKGGRYIYAIRDPRDVLVSQYRFLEGWWFDGDAITIDTYAREQFMKDWQTRGYWRHITSWWEQRDNPAILFLCFEAMKTDLAGTIKRVADFIDIPLDDELFAIVQRQSSLEFMKAHEQHFDDHLVQAARNIICGIPSGGNSSKVRKGQVGEHRHELSDDILVELDSIWQATFGKKYGYQSYQELYDAIVARD